MKTTLKKRKAMDYKNYNSEPDNSEIHTLSAQNDSETRSLIKNLTGWEEKPFWRY